MESPHAALGTALIGTDVGCGVIEVAGQIAVREIQINIFLACRGQIQRMVRYIHLVHRNMEVLGVHTALVVVHKLQNHTVLGNHGRIFNMDLRSGALKYQGRFIRMEGRIRNGQYAVGISHGP